MASLLRLLAIASAVVTVVACSGNGCSCMEPIPGGFPPAERRAGVIQVRATQSMFQFLDMEAAKIVPALLGGSATFDVPPSCSGSNKVCCTMPPKMCRLSFDFRSLQLSPTPPNLLKLDTDFVLKTVDTLPVEFIGTTCVISIDSTRSGSQTVKVTGDVSFPVDATRKTTSIKLENTNIDIETGDIKFNEPGSGFLCSIIGLPGIETFVVNLFKGQLTSQLESTLSEQTCMKCMQKSDCNSFAADCKGGQCVDAMDACIQEVGVSGRLDVGALLASLSPSAKGKMDIDAVLGGWAEADSGLSLGMLGGGMGAPHNPCVPVVPPPAVMDVPASASFKTDTLSDGTPYHLGVGIHRSHLDKLGWAAFDGGALCLAIGTPQQALLSASTIGLVVPSLDDLTRGDAPMYLALRPQKPPSFRLGAGTFKAPMGMGPKEIDDPLMTVNLPELSIDFYAFVDDRYVRVMTLTSDLELPVGLDVDADGALVPLLGELDAAFKNVRVSNVELLDEDPAALAQAFPMLLAVAGGAIGGGLGPIALPDIMGLRPKVVRIGSSDPDGQGAPQFLALNANLESAAPLRLAAETEARLAALELPSTAEFAVTGRTARAPVARVDVAGSFWGSNDVEFSYRLDGGLWAPWQRTTQLVISDARLWLQARHRLEVRARAVGLPESVDRSPVELELLVDTVAPAGSFDADPADPGRVLFQAADRVSGKERLRYRFARPGEALSDWTDAAWAPRGAGRLDEWTVEVIDEVGNIGSLAFHGRTTAPSSGGCDCQVSRGRAPGAAPLVLGLGLLALLLRRRRRALLALLCLAPLAAPLAGCDRGLAPGEYANPSNLIGRWHDTAAREGVLHLSAYDENMGDLVYARVEDLAQPLRWQIIDGIDPLGERQGDDQPRFGVLEPGPDVGRWNAIALTQSGDPRIAYADLTERAVRWAVGPGRFRLGLVDTAPEGQIIGAHVALSLDAADVPSIAYAVTAIPDGDRFRAELRVATAAVKEPSGPAEWSLRVVDAGPVSCAGLCAGNQACVMDEMVNGMPNGDPARSRCVVKDTAACPTMCADDQACIAAACVPAIGKPKQNSLIEGIGLFIRALRSPDGRLVLVYYDATQGDLKVARDNGSGFDVQIVDGGDPLTDVGQFCAAAFDESGTLHLAYQDAISDRLLYRTVSGGAPGAVELIDDGLRMDGVHPVGAGAALLVRNGAPIVAYQDQRLSDLLLATRSGTWAWQPLAMGGEGFGFSTRLTSDAKGAYLTQFVYDRGADVLGAVRLARVP